MPITGIKWEMASLVEGSMSTNQRAIVYNPIKIGVLASGKTCSCYPVATEEEKVDWIPVLGMADPLSGGSGVGTLDEQGLTEIAINCYTQPFPQHQRCRLPVTFVIHCDGFYP
jgi:hypothetical protein